MQRYFKTVLLTLLFLMVFIIPTFAQSGNETYQMPSWLQLLSDNWLMIASFLGGALIKETWVLAVNKFIKKSRIIIGKVKDGLENTDEFLDVLEGVTEDGKINKDEIIASVEAGKEFYVEQKGIVVSFKKKK